MRTHKGNVGAILADIGEVTISTLNKFEIPYDELFFGKPYANYYVDDLAVNPYVSLNESTGSIIRIQSQEYSMIFLLLRLSYKNI